MKRVLLHATILGLVLGLGACSSSPVAHRKNEYLTGATLWFQTSGENRALQYQAYRLARMLLDQDAKAKRKKGDLPPAVIMDIDETILDNSPFQGRVVLTDVGYPAGWDEWVSLAKARPIPGAVDYLVYAHNKGYRIFYITNRKQPQMADTMKNLKAMGFPDVSEETLMGRVKELSKEARRLKVREKYRVAFLFGDNLNDFAKDYEDKKVNDRMAAVEKTRDKFGTEYIVLPNPMYGDWEAALYQYNFARPEEEREQIRKASLTGF